MNIWLVIFGIETEKDKLTYQLKLNMMEYKKQTGNHESL